MSISMEPFASEGHFATYNSLRAIPKPVAMFRLECRSCGFEATDTVVAPRVCPKCHANNWERFTRPGSLLDNANNH